MRSSYFSNFNYFRKAHQINLLKKNLHGSKTFAFRRQVKNDFQKLTQGLKLFTMTEFINRKMPSDVSWIERI